jgi:hypothetical protein
MSVILAGAGLLVGGLLAMGAVGSKTQYSSPNPPKPDQNSGNTPPAAPQATRVKGAVDSGS